MKKLPLILAIVFMFGVVVGCVVWYKTATTPFAETAEPLFTKEDYPRVDASLAIHPLVDAIAAGNTVVLKPSAYSPATGALLGQMIGQLFPTESVAVVQGGREENGFLLDQKFDLIFFTGSQSVGKEVLRRAAEHLTPAVLELGGKSPVIVDKTANIPLTAKRLAFGKILNAGQTCIAPDYLLIHHSKQEQFIDEFKQAVKRLHGDDVRQSPHFVRMVNERAFDRVAAYLNDGRVVAGGTTVKAERYIEPTLLADVAPTAPVMQEEIFGPLFPLLTFNTTEEAIEFVTRREKPLALYYFGENGKNIAKVLKHTSSGGACINDTIMHIANENLPFGGVGHSGMSSYHGRESFRVFSHHRAVVTTPTWLDLPFRYMPYKFFGMVKKLL